MSSVCYPRWTTENEELGHFLYRAIAHARLVSTLLKDDLQWWGWLNNFVERLDPDVSDVSTGNGHEARNGQQPEILFFRIFACDHLARISIQQEGFGPIFPERLEHS